MPTSPPQVNAFILCDQAFQQAHTGKWCVIGAFGVVWVREFPAVAAPFMVFIDLSDFSGDTSLQISVRDNVGVVLHATRGQLPKLPMGMIEFAMPVPPVKFEREAVYSIELIANDQILSVRSFQVKKAPPQPQPGQNPPGKP